MVVSHIDVCLLFCPIVSPAVLQISAGFQQVKLGERGGRRRDFHDSGVNTRQLMEHVKDSKTGQRRLHLFMYF